jgi:ferrous iron transport protein B
MPAWRSVLMTVTERSRLFLLKAGTVILAASVVLWFLASYPKGGAEVRALEAQRSAAVQAGDSLQAHALDQHIAGVALEHSFAGQAGKLIEPAIAPLGFDWRIGIGLITSLAAREVMVSTMATVYNLGNSAGSVHPLRATLREARDARTGERAYSPLTGVSLMVFFALACQCMSTLAIVHRETNSWRWPLVMLVLMNGMAWLASFAVFQGGRLLGYGS